MKKTNSLASEQLLTTTEAAQYLGVSNSTIYRMADNKILHPVKTPGGQRRFHLHDLDKYKQASKHIKAPQNPSTQLKSSKGKATDEPQFEQLDLLGFTEKLPAVSFGSIETIEPIEMIEAVEELDSDATDEQNLQQESQVDPRNKLNDLTGKEWLPETKSFFFQKGLGSKHPHAQIERLHPAPFSFQDVARLIQFFTKEGQLVLDPFSGVGSTLKACGILQRKGVGIELSEQWHSLAQERLEVEVETGESAKHTFIQGDCRTELKKFDNDTFDFMVTSPPYWSILNKKADHKVKKERIEQNLATNYSTNDNDLGNIDVYEDFLDILVRDVFIECGRVIKPQKYMCIIVSDFRNKSEFVSFHSDLIQKLNNAPIDTAHYLSLQGVKVLLQNHKGLLPYGYPFAYVENIHHQYMLLFRKEVKKSSRSKKKGSE